MTIEFTNKMIKLLKNANQTAAVIKEIKRLENLTITKWQVWVNKGSQPIIMSLPFNNVNTVFEFLCENLNKRPVSISKL